MERRVTLSEVATQAGVSASTVCRALRLDPRIPVSTREKIQRVAEQLGYRPDPLLSAFASRRRGKESDVTTIAYVTNFTSAFGWRKNSFYRDCYDGACARAAKLGYSVEHFWLREAGMTGKRLSRILYNRGISSLCIAPTLQPRGHMSLDWDRFSAVTIGYSVLRPALNRVATHHFHGLLLALRELRKVGYSRIGFCLFAGTSKRVDDLWLAAALVYRQYHSEVSLPVFLFTDETVGRIPEWCAKERLEVVIGGEPIVHEQIKKSGVDVDFATVIWTEEEKDIAGIDQRADLVGAGAIDIVTAQQRRGERGIPEVPTTTMVEARWHYGKSLRRSLRRALAPRA